MRIVPGFVLREIVGETVAIPTGDAVYRLSGLAALNESGKLLFELLQTEQTEQTLAQGLMQTYEVDEQTAAEDVAEFLEILRQNRMLLE